MSCPACKRRAIYNCDISCSRYCERLVCLPRSTRDPISCFLLAGSSSELSMDDGVPSTLVHPAVVCSCAVCQGRSYDRMQSGVTGGMVLGEEFHIL